MGSLIFVGFASWVLSLIASGLGLLDLVLVIAENSISFSLSLMSVAILIWKYYSMCNRPRNKNTPTDEHSLTQAPIMGGLGFSLLVIVCCVMSGVLWSFIAFLVVKSGGIWNLDISSMIEDLIEAVIGFVTGLVLLIQKVIRDILNLNSKPGSGSQEPMVMGMNCNDAPLDTKPQDLEKTNNILTMEGKGSGDTPEGALTSSIPDSRPVTPDAKTDSPKAFDGFYNKDAAVDMGKEMLIRATESAAAHKLSGAPSRGLPVALLIGEGVYRVSDGLTQIADGKPVSPGSPTDFGGKLLSVNEHAYMDKNKFHEPLSLDSKENGTPTTPENLSFKNKPTQGGFDSIWLLLLAYFTESSEYGQILLPFDPIVLTKADPFFFNMCLLYLNVCEFCILFAVFLLFISPIAISIYTYNKLPNLKSYFSKKENILWARLWLNVIPIIIINKLIFNPYGSRFYLLIKSFIVFINTGSFSYYYYNPPGLAMGRSRVLHPADYTHIATYFNFQYINPDYILHVVTFIKFIAIFIIAYTVYFIIATVTTAVYSDNKDALSLPGGPASLNLFTKCFYFKSQQARINNLLLFSAIVLILLVLTSFVLYHYINIYHLG